MSASDTGREAGAPLSVPHREGEVSLSALSDEILGEAILAAIEKATPEAWIERDPQDTVWDRITIDGKFSFGEIAKQLRWILIAQIS